jgi:hypothetical protein
VHWIIPVTLTVQDQFEKPIGAVWNSALMWENDTGFDPEHPDQGTSIGGGAVTDNVQLTIPGFTKEEAEALAAKTWKPWPTVVKSNSVISYKITDGITTYNLEYSNRRVVTRTHDNDLTNLDAKQ